MHHCVAFKCRLSQLHAGNIGSVALGLGIGSQMQHLDLSDNRIGMSAASVHTTSGIQLLMNALVCTMQIRVLKLGRNSLRDEEVECIATAVKNMPTLEVLDLQGNYCHDIGMEYLKAALLRYLT